MSEVVAATKLPWAEAVERLEPVEEKMSEVREVRYLMTSMMMPAFDAAFLAAARATAWTRSADAEIAVELFHRRHGRLPESLEELVPNFLPQVPGDPFSGEPLKYKIEQQGYVVYSVGPDLADDGGKEEKRQRGPDLVFRVASPKSK